MRVPTWFMLEVGMRNPRNRDEIAWRELEGFCTLPEPRRAALDLVIWRIVKCNLVAFDEAVPVQAEGRTP